MLVVKKMPIGIDILRALIFRALTNVMFAPAWVEAVDFMEELATHNTGLESFVAREITKRHSRGGSRRNSACSIAIP
jgi:hypothetical protein